MNILIIKKTAFSLLFTGITIGIFAQNRVTTVNKTGSITENGVTYAISEETTTRYRRVTSQGDPEARLEYLPNSKPDLYSQAIARSVMARYPDYRKAYWKDYTYVHGYMFEAMDRLGELTGDKRYAEYIKSYIDNFIDKDGNYKFWKNMILVSLRAV